MSPFLNGFDPATVRVGVSSSPLTSLTIARSPFAVPAKTRLPDAKTTSGLSVRGSITTSPRIPCALRISPTIAYSGSVIVERALGAGPRCYVRHLADRHCDTLALETDSLFVAVLEDTGPPKERPDGIGGLCALVQPVVGSRLVDVERALTLAGSVLTDDLDEFSIARTLRVGDENAVERGVFPPDAAESNLYHFWTAPLRVCLRR